MAAPQPGTETSMGGIPLFPEAASSFAAEVDALYLFIVAVSAFFTVAVSIAVVAFGIKYRRKHAEEIGAHIEGSLPLELAWSIIPTIISMVMFGWGAKLFYEMRVPPAETLQIYAVGKQWMWKFQHTGGQREINELHVPMGRPIKMLVTSEDVLHDLYFPAFRTKIDAIPGRYMPMWFTATKPGRYHIFCAEYCGTKHSGMIGTVVVMEPQQYQSWLAGGGTEGIHGRARRPSSSTTWPATPAISTAARAAGPRSKTSWASRWNWPAAARRSSTKATCANRFSTRRPRW